MDDVYYYLIVLFALIFITPFVVCFFRSYIRKYLEKNCGNPAKYFWKDGSINDNEVAAAA
jgi:hypothetical protein